MPGTAKSRWKNAVRGEFVRARRFCSLYLVRLWFAFHPGSPVVRLGSPFILVRNTRTGAPSIFDSMPSSRSKPPLLSVGVGPCSAANPRTPRTRAAVMGGKRGIAPRGVRTTTAPTRNVLGPQSIFARFLEADATDPDSAPTGPPVAASLVPASSPGSLDRLTVLGQAVRATLRAR